MDNIDISPDFHAQVETRWQQFLTHLREWGFCHIADHLDYDKWHMKEEFYLIYEGSDIEDATLAFALEYISEAWATA